MGILKVAVDSTTQCVYERIEKYEGFIIRNHPDRDIIRR
jgi:hypothetical protein